MKTWRNLWIHSGDNGYFDADGFLYFVGRQPHWLRRKGENLSAREVEEAIRTIDGVADAAVAAVASELGDDDIRAFVVLRADAVLSAELCGRGLPNAWRSSSCPATSGSLPIFHAP